MSDNSKIVHTFTKSDGITLGHPFELGKGGSCNYLILKRSDGGEERCGFAADEHSPLRDQGQA